MAKEKGKSTRTSIDEINDSLSSIEQKVEGNKKNIGIAIAAVVVVIAAVLGYYYLVYTPNVEKAKEEMSKADMTQAMGQDSLALKQYEAIADNYSNSAANRADLNAAIILFNQGKFQEAAKYLSDYDPKGELVGPASQSLLGDCYVNLKKYDDAIKAFDKAISLSNDNALYTPLFILKKANVLRELKKYDDEAKAYETIKTKFPKFSASYNVDIDKFLARANAQAGK